ncbi:MFS transporter [Arthrobacter sp. AQ5-05]|uniref:MFS transporter n=1 Tax=Arthrobacter sp. AQ5-05 TaxID=2184581 RepID=UPI0015EB5CF4
MAPIDKRGLWSSLTYVSGTIGVVAGTLMGAVMTLLFTHDQMVAWGWRVPFILRGVLGLHTLIMRASLKETDDFKRSRRNQGRRSSRFGSRS